MFNNEQQEEAESIKDTMYQAQQERAIAYHDTFVKNPAGAKILSEWINTHCMGGIPGNNATEREVALRDGKQQLIKMIISQINKATGEQK